MGRWRGESSGLLILRFAAAVSATPQPVSWLPREASGPAWVTSGPGLSHRQQPGCPATRKGTKGTFDVQRPSSRHTLRTEQQARRTFLLLPHPLLPFLLPEQSRQIQQGHPKGHHPPGQESHGCCLSKTEAGKKRVFPSVTCLPPWGVHLTQEVQWCLEMWKGEAILVTIPGWHQCLMVLLSLVLGP